MANPPRDHNNPPILPRLIAEEQNDFAPMTTAYMQEEHAKLPQIAEALLAEAREIPKVINDDETKSKVTSLIRRIRDAAKVFDDVHSREKMPYKRGGEAVDQFCFGWIDKLSRRSKTNNPGAADILLARLTDYDNRKLAEENERRRKEAEETARIAREAQEKADREAAAAEEARLAAERARKPETIEAKTEVAMQKEADASTARVEVVVATGRAEEAHVATLARPADIMRTRGDDGTLSTMGQEKYAEILDKDLLDKAALWPFIKQADLQKALRAWADSTDYRKEMPGASVGRRNKSLVR
jgi:hypothetical protein